MVFFEQKIVILSPIKDNIQVELNFCESSMGTKKVLDKQQVAESLSALLEPLSDVQRDYLLDNIDIHVYKKNEEIYREGDHPKFLMYLLEGKVKVYKDGNGGRQILRMIKETGFFAYRASFANEDYLTGASAFEQSVVYRFPVDVIKKLITENSQLALFFIKQLAFMLGVADTLTVNLTQKHIRGRLAESLISLEDKYGVEEDGSTLNIYLSREDMANMSNMTTSNAIRTLSAFASEGLIAIDGRKIRIIEDKQLRNISKKG